MLQYGLNITQAADPLHPREVAELARRLLQPKPAIKNGIDQLRVLKTLDKTAYNAQKKQLPYIVCGIFKPAIRRREHLASISHFMIDLDGIAAHFDMHDLRQTLIADPRVALLFTSPGGDGLKLLFHLDKPCTDGGLYAAFYRLFVAAFAGQYNLHPVIDRVTSDATRACFISYDEQTYYNDAAEAVSLAGFCSAEPDTLWQEQAGAEIQFAAQKAEKEGMGEKEAIVPEPKGPSDGVLQAIRLRLNPNARRPPPEKQYIASPQVDESIETIRQHLQSVGIALVEVTPINYGRKLRISAGDLWAEVNIFYGRRGFSLVATPKTGSNAGLAALGIDALNEILHTLPVT